MGFFIRVLSRIANGLVANDGTGDPLRTGGDKINDNYDVIVDTINALASSQNVNMLAFATKADMDADTSRADGTVARVLFDADPENNKTYAWTTATSAWVETLDALSYDLANTAVGKGASRVVLESGRTLQEQSSDTVCVLDYPGVTGLRSDDQTTGIIAAHATGRCVYYPDGVYTFTGENLDLSGGILRESTEGVVFANGRYDGIISFDRSGALIGLHHNHLEHKATGADPTPAITTGNIVAPPSARAQAGGPVDVLAFWYQDFGLDSIRANSVGSHVWYTWEWAHTDAVVDLGATPRKRGYQAKRHPLLGWYRGDDVNVLDWQCYWLRESNVAGVIVQPRGANIKLDTTAWTSTSNLNNWIYKLLHLVPNAAGLGVVPWVDSGNFGANYGNPTAIASTAAAWDNNVQVVHDAGRGYVVALSGKQYLMVYMFEGDSLRGDLDNFSGSTNLQSFLVDRATFAKTLGYDGIAVHARHPTTAVSMDRGALLKSGVLYFAGAYVSSLTNATTPATYSDALAGWENDVPLVSVPAVHTEVESSSHPSNYNQSGSSPDLFRQMLSKAIRYATKTPNCPKLVTIYNVSEWAEGGASLQPTVGNGWGYLDAVSDALRSAGAREIPQEKMTHYFKPTSSVPVLGPLIGVSSDFNQTFGFTPFLAAGSYEGQRVTVVNRDLIGGKTVTLPDNSVTAGSNLFFRGSANKVLPPWASVDLRWWVDKGGWVEA